MVKNTIFTEKTCRLLTPKNATQRICVKEFVEKTSMNSHKTTKFVKVFWLASFPLYSTSQMFLIQRAFATNLVY